MPEKTTVEELYSKCANGMVPTNDMIRLWLINLEDRVRKLESSRSRSVTASKRGRTR